MCCSVSPGVSVAFTDTVLYGAEVIGEAGEPVHVLGYQNKVQGRVGWLSQLAGWLPFGHTGNAMILPFPAVPRTMTQANVLDTASCRGILQDMADAVAPPVPHASTWRRMSMLLSDEPRVQVFQTGIYTVVLADDPRDIPAALHRVPSSKRPTLNPALFDAYARWYPGWTMALCCFNNARARLADPLLWWYRPMRPDRLFLPAVDCHTGDIPDLDAQVSVDHVVAVGSHRMTGGQRVYYQDDLPVKVAPYLLTTLIGQRFSGPMPNGDFIFQMKDVRRGSLSPIRSKPLAA